MNKLTILIVALGFFLNSCGGDGKTATQSTSANKKETFKVTKELYDFSRSADEVTSEWTEFKLLTKRVNEIVQEVKNPSIENLDALSKDISSVEKTVPKKIQNISLNARLTVLRTQLGLYRDFVASKNPSNKEAVQGIDNIIDAYNHTIFQINDIVEKVETEEKYKHFQ